LDLNEWSGAGVMVADPRPLGQFGVSFVHKSGFVSVIFAHFSRG
jgi:hypothetical protein